MRKSMLSFLVVALFATSTTMAKDFRTWTSGRDCIKGSGKLVTEIRDVGEFTKIESRGSADIIVTVGKDQQVSLTFDDNLINLIKTDVHGKTLTVSSEGSFSCRRSCKVEITVPNLEQVSVAGSGDVEIFNLSGEYFEYKVSGSGDMRAEGRVDQIDIGVRGSGDIDTRELTAREATVKLSGSGDVKVYASESFYGRVSGSGDVDIYGNPEHISRHVSGSGDIRKRR